MHRTSTSVSGASRLSFAETALKVRIGLL